MTAARSVHRRALVRHLPSPGFASGASVDELTTMSQPGEQLS
jgi:hypothetical protein